jgi:hypothetical protein
LAGFVNRQSFRGIFQVAGVITHGGTDWNITAPSKGTISVYNKVGREGLEPSKAEPADLQSAPFAARDTDPRTTSIGYFVLETGPQGERPQPTPSNEQPPTESRRWGLNP